MNASSRVLAVVLLVAVCGTLGWILTPSDGEAPRESLAPGARSTTEGASAPSAPAAASDEPSASATSRDPGRGAPITERRVEPDQLELRRELAAAETRHMEAMEAAFAALRESRGPGCIEGWRDESGELRLDAPAPPQPCLVRYYDLPADPVEPAPDPRGKGASQAAPRVRVLAVHLTKANAPQVFAAQVEAERLRARLR